MIKLHWLWGRRGGLNGLVLSWRPVTITPVPEPIPPDEPTLVPACYRCHCDALLFCRTHQVPVCRHCVELHAQRGDGCFFSSIYLPDSILRQVVRQL